MRVKIIPVKETNAYSVNMPDEEFERFLKERAAYHDHNGTRASVYKTTGGGCMEIVFSEVLRFEAETDAQANKRRDDAKRGSPYA